MYEYRKACSTDAAIYNSAHNAPSIHQTGYVSIGKHAPQMQPYTTVFIMHNPSHWICEYWKACLTDATIHNSVHNAPSIHHPGYVSIGKHAPQMKPFTTVLIINLSSVTLDMRVLESMLHRCNHINSAHNAPSITLDTKVLKSLLHRCNHIQQCS